MHNHGLLVMFLLVNLLKFNSSLFQLITTLRYLFNIQKSLESIARKLFQTSFLGYDVDNYS